MCHFSFVFPPRPEQFSFLSLFLINVHACMVLPQSRAGGIWNNFLERNLSTKLVSKVRVEDYMRPLMKCLIASDVHAVGSREINLSLISGWAA